MHTLKDLINTSPLGPVDRSEQRLFHLGKEMKGNGRNLEVLGIGNYNVFSIHLHSTRPKVNELLESDDDDDDVVAVVDVTESNRRVGTRNNNRKREDPVVDLLDSDSDDDIEVVQVTGNKRQRKNEITID